MVMQFIYFLAFGPLTRSPEQGREGRVYNEKKNFSSFLDELDHLEKFKHFFQKSHYPGELAGELKNMLKLFQMV